MADKPKAHPLQRAWAAGMFDGKAVIPKDAGHLYMDGQDEAVLRRFHELIGVGYVKCITDRPGMNNSRWRWGTSNMDDCREAILFVAPFLSPKKTKLCADKIARIERNPVWKKKHPEKAAKLEEAASSVQSAKGPTTP